MKQVVALLGSRRKKNTYRLLSEIQEILKKHEIELHIIELCHCNVTPCAGCERCILQGQCMLNDDAADIMKRLSEADGIVLASPVYLKQVSGQLKTFFDRTCMWYHRPVLAEKPVLSVSTTKGSGLRKTLSYLSSIAVQWGAVPAGTKFRQSTPSATITAEAASSMNTASQQPRSALAPLFALRMRPNSMGHTR